MAKEPDVAEEEQPEQPEEEEELSQELSLEELKPKLYRMVYNNPTILLGMLETLFDLLEARGVMRPGEADTIITEGLRRWRDVVGPT